MNVKDQAVVDESNVGEQPPASDDNAQDELQTLLDGYEQKEEVAATTSKTGEAEASSDKMDEILDRVKAQEDRHMQQANSNRLAASVITFKEVVGEIPDSLARTLLNGAAAEDPRIATAFANAESNPQAWDKIVKAVGNNYKKHISSLPDAETSSLKDGVVAAVSSASTKTPTGDDITDESVMNMSTAEFNKMQRDLGVEP